MSKNKSTISATATSDWPTPTVSTRMTSYPAFSQSKMASFVQRETPPSVPEVGEGRIKAFSSRDSSVMRVLSPNNEPKGGKF